MDFSREDAKSEFANIQHEEKLLRKKRRWLMGLSHIRNKTPNFLKNESMHETFLRDEDVSCHNVREFVEKSFDAFRGKQEGHYVVQDYLRPLKTNTLHGEAAQPPNILMVVSSILDNLNNKGLFHLVSIITGSSIKFEKTRPRMKAIIKGRLLKLLTESNHEHLIEPLSQLLMDPQNFRETYVTILATVTRSHVYAAHRILEKLDSVRTQALVAMYRKLRGVVSVPQINVSGPDFIKAYLIRKVHKICRRMLLELNEGEELPKPLAKAMAIASLSLRQVLIFSDFILPEFYHLPPELEDLQYEILKALEALPKIPSIEMKDLHTILDPNAEISPRKFRSATRKLLNAYLFECGDIHIPKSFIRALSFINRKSHRRTQFCFSREKMEEEVECVLDVSAQLRQIVWNVPLDHNFEQEFVDAYMDELKSEDSEVDETEIDDDKNYSNFESFNLWSRKDDHFDLSNHHQFYRSPSQSDDDAESVGDSILPFTTNGCTKHLNGNSFEGLKFENVTRCRLRDPHNFSASSGPDDTVKSRYETSPNKALENSSNQYLAVQDICDEASLVAHKIMGRLLEAFSQLEGTALDTIGRSYLQGGASGDAYSRAAGESHTSFEKDRGLILIRAVEEIIPSFPKSGIERVKKLMELQ